MIRIATLAPGVFAIECPHRGTYARRLFATRGQAAKWTIVAAQAPRDDWIDAKAKHLALIRLGFEVEPPNVNLDEI